MRTAFINTLTELAVDDPDLILVVGDLGFGVVQEFAERFPNQFVNAGVAEQNMTSLAAGLALAGKKVYTYSIANFPTLRCLEQIRNDICYHNANVTVVAVGGGFAYGALGMTHHATEDLAILRALPELKVVAPGDPVETCALMKQLHAHTGPTYLRLGRAGEPVLHSPEATIQFGKAAQLCTGSDVTLISTGGMLYNAVEAAKRLNTNGYHASVLSLHTLKPIDAESIIEAAANTKCIVTLEEHSVVGGLGGAVAEVLCDAGLNNFVLKRMGVPSEFSTEVGDQEHLRRHHGLDVESIVQIVQSFIDANRNRIQQGVAA